MKLKQMICSILTVVLISSNMFITNAATVNQSLVTYTNEEIIESNIQNSVENINTENLEWKTFYEQTSQLVREEWSENYFDTIELNFNNNSIAIDKRKINYSLENFKDCVQNYKEDMKKFNSYKEKENDLILPISDILNIIGSEITRKDEKIIINDLVIM